MQSKKQQQVSEIIRRNFGTVLFNLGPNIYGGALVTVTTVNMTPDLSLAKIYLSVYNTENKPEIIMLLNKEKRSLKSGLVHRIRRHVRRIPDIDFYLDDTIDEMYRVDQLFEKLYAENQMGEEE